MLRLLIIDDESAIRAGISAYFPWSSLGIEVAATCQDGLEALAVMEKATFDLILCDIRMPRMDGIQFAEKVRERGYPCDIVFISAYKDFAYAKKAIELGAREYIVKPAGFDELNEVFSKIAKERAVSAERAANAERNASAEPDRQESPVPTASLAERATRLFERDLVNISLPSIASKLNMSPNYLSAKLHQETGKTFSELLLDARMKKAERLLANPANRVGAISALVGYANTKSFIRAFRLYFGSSPTAFRCGAQRRPDA
ncbi:MAG TPA: response regulator [Rectinemataceae bacterium]|nr:response regulator [Rectinemataceae bacterium]